MSHARKEYSVDELEVSYNEITVLYDLAGELVETVESQFVSDPEMQLALVEPLINELGDATDDLTAEFLHIAEGTRRKGMNKVSKARVEASLRRVYGALNEYRTRVQSVTQQAYGNLMNIADPIAAKIQRQVEKVVVVFLEFIQLSLASIMNKTELDTLRQRESRVALMMHNLSQQQPT